MTNEKLEKQILTMVKQNASGLSSKEVAQKMNMTSKSAAKNIRKTIMRLKNQGRLFKNSRSKKYICITPAINVTGEIQLTRAGFGFVKDSTNNSEIYISRDHLNTALNRDQVEVKLYAHTRGKHMEGYVTKIVKRHRTVFVGTYHKTAHYNYVVPDDPKIYRDFYISEENQKDAKEGQKVLVSLERWQTDHLNPEGSIVDIIGFPGEVGVDIASVAYGHQLHIKFSQPALSELKELPPITISKQEIEKRLDLRDQICFTIDPEDAKDFDDAVSLEQLDNGNLNLGVHIADVSYYVKKGSEIDKEALDRGTSVYLVDRVIPMLPEELANNLCSLQPDTDKLTYSCIMEVTRQGKVVAYRIQPSIIKSKRRYSYQQVQDILDHKAEDNFSSHLQLMLTLSKVLTKKRLSDGSIDFETPEVAFTLDEKGFPVAIKRKNRLDSHRLIEEFMLLANRTVTEHFLKLSEADSKLPFIYRVHEKPDQEKMTKFLNFLHALAIELPKGKQNTSKFFQTILNTIKDSNESFVIREVTLRSMMKATYDIKNIGHFGLGFKNYTHFTSPIRRYPDLTVHRLLKKYTINPPNALNVDTLTKSIQEICIRSTKTERTAMEAERDSIRLKQNEYISRHIGEEYDGIISGVLSFGIFVELTDTLVEGLVHIQNINDDYYIYDEKSYSLIGRETNRRLRLADPVRVRVQKVNLETGKVDFDLVN
jgi:ribonuclease R